VVTAARHAFDRTGRDRAADRDRGLGTPPE
jgi:hypothetical protein